jgi:hypothetical protein
MVKNMIFLQNQQTSSSRLANKLPTNMFRACLKRWPKVNNYKGIQYKHRDTTQTKKILNKAKTSL